MFAPEFDAVYTKCSSTIWVDVRLPEWIPYLFAAWYFNLEGELISPLRGFDLDDDGFAAEGEVIDP